MPSPAESRHPHPPTGGGVTGAMRLLFLAALTLLTWSCGGRAAGAAQTAAAAPLLVGVATNFAPAFDVLAEQFTTTTGTAIRVVTGATGTLYAQIVAGAPFDVLFAADGERPRRLERDGLALPDTRRVYVHGRLALCGDLLHAPAPAAEPAIATLRTALDDPRLQKLAIANPDTAPYGQAALRTLRALDRTEACQDRLVFGANVAQALQFAMSGAADLGFVALASLRASDPPPAHVVVPTEYSGTVVQEAVILRDTRQPAAARALLDHLDSEAARAVLRRYGYDLPR